MCQIKRFRTKLYSPSLTKRFRESSVIVPRRGKKQSNSVLSPSLSFSLVKLSTTSTRGRRSRSRRACPPRHALHLRISPPSSFLNQERLQKLFTTGAVESRDIGYGRQKIHANRLSCQLSQCNRWFSISNCDTRPYTLEIA